MGLRLYGSLNPAAGLSISPVQGLRFGESATGADRILADKYVTGIVAAPGVDRSWFDDSPRTQLRSVKDVDPAYLAKMEEYIQDGHFGSQAFYIWNDNYLNSEVCNPNDKIFHGVPSEFQVFHAPDDQRYPRFRFPPNRLLPSGLRTNRYGFRGPDFAAEREPRTIRIAFIGSSETVGVHSYPLSYPEYFGFWLEKWLRAQRYDLHVQVLNSGREGIGTTDVTAVLKQEILPLHPDYVMFYDGANQLAVSDDLLKSAVPLQRAAHANWKPASLFPAWLLKHSRAAALVDPYYRQFIERSERQRPKPNYTLELPAGLDENYPDVDSSNLPLALPVFRP